jgi:hypothetical protein
MTGLLLAKPWEGHRNEAFAEYVLSSIATVVRVPRQADFGFDLLCTLTCSIDNGLYAGKSFGIQIKPPTTKRVCYGTIHKKNGKWKWKNHEIDWLFRQDQPLFLGIVDLKSHSMSLYSTHRMWWVYNEIGNPGKIILVPEAQPSGQIGWDWFKRTELPPLDGGKKAGDGFCYEVPLGKPVARIDVERLENEDQYFRQEIERTVKDAVDLTYRNIMNCQKNIPITEDQDVWTGGTYQNSLFYHPINDKQKRALFLYINPAITSLLQNHDFLATNDLKSIKNMAEFLKTHRCLSLEGILLLERIETGLPSI